MPLADAGMTFMAKPAGAITIGVGSLADAGMVTIGEADSADAGAVSLIAPVGIPDSPEYSRGVVSCGGQVSSGVWCRQWARIQSDLDCRCVDCGSCNPVGMGCTVPTNRCSGSFGTLLSGPLCPVADDVTYWGGFGALGGGGYDYEEGPDDQPRIFFLLR